MPQNQQLLSSHVNNLPSHLYFYTKHISHYFPNLIVLDYNIKIIFSNILYSTLAILKISFFSSFPILVLASHLLVIYSGIGSITQ